MSVKVLIDELEAIRDEEDVLHKRILEVSKRKRELIDLLFGEGYVLPFRLDDGERTRPCRVEDAPHGASRGETGRMLVRRLSGDRWVDPSGQVLPEGTAVYADWNCRYLISPIPPASEMN